MALVGRRDGRNFGYGRQLSYAGPQALKDMFGGGHYGTVKAHSNRWFAFVKWCRSEQGPGINDARQIDRKVLAGYAAYLRYAVECGDLAVSTAQNRLSSVNRTMAALRGDQCVKLPSPSKALGMQRTGVRLSVPQGQDREQVKQIVDGLCRHHHPRAAAIVLLARATGMRLRETILADLQRLIREADGLGRINIHLHSENCLFPSRLHASMQSPPALRQNRKAIGLDSTLYGLHTMIHTKALLIYRRPNNLKAVQALLGHTKLETRSDI